MAAVHQPVGVPQLVQGFLAEAFGENALAPEAIAGDETRRRHDRRPAAELRLAEDEGQNRDEQVDVGQSENLGGVDVTRLEPLEDPAAFVLAATSVPRFLRPFGLEPEGSVLAPRARRSST